MACIAAGINAYFVIILLVVCGWSSFSWRNLDTYDFS